MASTSFVMDDGEYDVFLSFRGTDTRTNFTSHLYTALRKEGVKVFMDKNLRRGDEISSTLFKIIETSQISIIVFSQNYATSNFCLEELVKILECKASRGQIVFPVFYNVDPFEVEKQTGHYGIALSSLEFEFMGKLEKVRRWRSALSEAADLSGWDLRHRDESEVIREIVQDVLRKLKGGQSTSASMEAKERRINEEKQKALRKLALIESIKTDMTKVLTDSNKTYKYEPGKSMSQAMEDSMSRITRVYDTYNKGLSRWNEMMLNDLLFTGSSSTSTNPGI